MKRSHNTSDAVRLLFTNARISLSVPRRPNDFERILLTRERKT